MMNERAVGFCLALVVVALSGCSPKVPVPEAVRHPKALTDESAWSMTEAQVAAVEPVLQDLARELAKIAPKYPEMSDYREEKVLWRLDKGMGLEFSHDFTRPREKRNIRSSDFGPEGLLIEFSCGAMPSSPDQGVYQMDSPTVGLSGLRLGLWIDLRTGANPSAGMVEEVTHLLRQHRERLEEMDKQMR